MQELTQQDQLVQEMLLMSDEANFHVSGFVNKQNFRHWSSMKPGKVVRCAIGAECVIGPYFFEPYLVSI